MKIFDAGYTQTGRAYFVMEMLEGETLASVIARLGRLPLPQISELGRQIASVLAATHVQGITHRDLKPDNIFIVADHELASGQRVRILDFGIAKLTGTLGQQSPGTSGTMGTPAYMAPEQWGNSANTDFRSDLYSLGCVLFEMACGRPPFTGASYADFCSKHLTAKPPLVSEYAHELGPALDALVARLLSKDPAQRGASVKEVERELEALGGAGAPIFVAGAHSRCTRHRPRRWRRRDRLPGDAQQRGDRGRGARRGRDRRRQRGARGRGAGGRDRRAAAVPCEVVGERFAQLADPHQVLDDVRDTSRDLLIAHCRAEEWSESNRRCFVVATSAAQGTACLEALPEASSRRLDADFTTAMRELRRSWIAIDGDRIKVAHAISFAPDPAELLQSHVNDDRNRDVSVHRAEAVRAELVKNGVSPEMITTTGMGNDRRIDASATPEAARANDRIELHVVPEPAPATPPAP